MKTGLAQFYQEHSLGHVYEDSDVTVFFGDARSLPPSVESAFPDFSLSILKQTHSDVVIQAPFAGEPPEADAQWTREKRIALCIRTADCTPVLLYDSSSGLVGAAHAGWRGVENEVVRKLCVAMTREGAEMDRVRAWIGPHIGESSFEVGLDVAARLEARFDAVRGFSPIQTYLLAHDDPTKARVNLTAIVRAQLGSAGIEEESILELRIDTFQSEAHQSYRRDRSNTGRQISFIALKGT